MTYLMVENSLEKKRINGLLYGHFVVTDHSAAVRKREARDAAANCGVLGGKFTKNDKGGYSSHWSPHRMEEPEKCESCRMTFSAPCSVVSLSLSLSLLAAHRDMYGFSSPPPPPPNFPSIFLQGSVASGTVVALARTTTMSSRPIGSARPKYPTSRRTSGARSRKEEAHL